MGLNDFDGTVHSFKKMFFHFRIREIPKKFAVTEAQVSFPENTFDVVLHWDASVDKLYSFFLHRNASVGKFYSFFTLQRTCTSIFAGGGTSQEKQNSV